MAIIEERKNSKGEVSYRARVRLKGFPPQTATFKRKTDAAKWLVLKEAELRENRHFKNSEAKKRTFAELVDRYLKTILPSKTESLKYQQNQKAQLNWWKEKMGVYLLQDITPSRISALKEELLSEASPATANRYLAALSHVFSKAVKEWEWLENNPVAKVDRAREPKGRVRFLNDKERKELLEVCKKINEELHLLVLLAISTGARKSELTDAKWADIDLKKEVLIFYKTKNSEIRKSPIKGTALELLKNQQKNSKNSIFIFRHKEENKLKTLERLWYQALEEAKIENFRFHDLRHCTGSYLAMNGATLAEIAEVLGHKTLQMVKRYAHLTEAHTSSVVEKMNKKVFG